MRCTQPHDLTPRETAVIVAAVCAQETDGYPVTGSHIDQLLSRVDGYSRAAGVIPYLCRLGFLVHAGKVGLQGDNTDLYRPGPRAIALVRELGARRYEPRRAEAAE